ncbi:FAD/NAD(P)-binding protein [Streptomyces sp. NPDC048442]|uniref:FAD/NAD(P)-binding protein n=1 Tax=Streptomyces sp. NPDC048442 TaxID=3154823 RepID=UPI00341EFCBD
MAEGTFRVVVVGAGAAGTLVSARLLDSAALTGRGVSIELVDPAPRSGPGLAYATSDPRHLLNVPAGRMSALPGDTDGFVRWLSHREGRRVDPGEYVPRGTYGTYLADALRHAVEAAGGVATLHRRYARVVAVEQPTGIGRVRLRLDNGELLDADAAVLALGNLAPSGGWVPEGLRRSPCFVADPWRPGALDGVPADRDVLLVGTGLTMCDVSRTLNTPGRTVHAVSRSGLVPLPHTTTPVRTPAFHPGPAPDPPDLARLRREVLHRAARYRRQYGDWRPAIDELRPHVAELWQRLSFADRERFLTGMLREWEVSRHRLAPATSRALTESLRSGLLTVRAAEVVAAQPGEEAGEEGGSVTVGLSDGCSLTVGAVVNCTGPEGRTGELTDPLARCLLDSGVAVAGPHGLGFDTTADGRLVPAPGRTPAPVWTLGQLRRGNLWETTAIPEIRVQAAELADRILAHAPAPLLV